MISTRKILTSSLFILTVLLSLLHIGVTQARAMDNQVNVIRHWSNPSYTRIVVNVGHKSPFKYHLLKKDPSINVPFRRLYVDIDGTTIAKNLKRSIPIHDGLLKGVRVGQYKEKTVRVVLDIESIEDFKIFSLDNPFRIIIDVTGEGWRTPPLEVAAPTPVKKTTSERKVDKKKTRLIKTIVIDPGHGGKDPGAIGRRGLKEKHVTLKIAKYLKRELERTTGAKIILTRTRDIYIPLEERTAIANTKRADLFISIHVNASPRRQARGIETYFLDVSNDKRTMRLAQRENAASAAAMDDLQFILADLIRTANRNDSSTLAGNVQHQLVSSLKRKYKGVQGNGIKGAPFYVLVRTNMPSILVETSFISNTTEEKRLKNNKYLQHIASGIAGGVKRFVDGKASVASNR